MPILFGDFALAQSMVINMYANTILSGEQFHLKISTGDIGKYVFLTGDPDRVKVIAGYLEEPVLVAKNREYTIYNAILKGTRVTVASTGIGGPSAAIAVEELANCGAHTFIRIGTSGGIDIKVCGGDLVIAQSAIRNDGTSNEYIPMGFPAVADFYVTRALTESAAEMSQDLDGARFHVGTVQSKDSFYGETNPERMPIVSDLLNRWDSFIKCGVLCSEMECAAIYAVGTSRGLRAGAVLTAIWNVERPKMGLENPINKDTTRGILCAINAMGKLIAGEMKG